MEAFVLNASLLSSAVVLTLAVSLLGCIEPASENSTAAEALIVYSQGNEVLPGWTTCSAGPGTNCGGTGGAGTIVDTHFDVNVSAGGRSGVASEHTAAGVDYGTSYWSRSTGTPTTLATSMDYTTDIYIPTSVGSNYQAIEWDTEQHLGGYITNPAWQAERVTGKWRWWNRSIHRWLDSGIPFTGFTPGVWHTVHAHYSVSNDIVTNDWLEIDGVRHVPTVPTASPRVPLDNGSSMHIGLQLDQDLHGDAMSIYWDNINLSYSDGSTPWPPPGGSACAAPELLSPYNGQGGCGPSVEVATRAPACIVATMCYLQSAGAAAVAAGTNAINSTWVAVPMGANSISCNGWDAKGNVYVGTRSAFTRTY